MKLSDAKLEPQLYLFSTPIAQPNRKTKSPLKSYATCQGPGCSKSLDLIRATRKFCSNACRQRAYDRRMKPPKPVVAVQHGNNSDLIAAAAKLYIRDGDRVADVTYGKGLFWKKTNTNRFTLLASDLQPRAHEAIPMDFRALAYADASLDHVILDPPYIHRPSPFYEQLYANQATTPDISHAEIIALYRAGMSEAVRALRRGGLLWAKGKDEIENGRQCWAHVELHTIAQELGMTAIDKLYLQTGLRMLDRRPTQRHSRRNVSFLWVFKKVRKSEAA